MQTQRAPLEQLDALAAALAAAGAKPDRGAFPRVITEAVWAAKRRAWKTPSVARPRVKRHRSFESADGVIMKT